MLITNFVLLTFVIVSDCEYVPFVVDGYYANILDFSYVAHLGIYCHRWDDFYNDSYSCGGSIVNQHFILTAAHCLFICGPKSVISVAVGHSEWKQGKNSSATSFFIHEMYDQTTLSNDIAILTVKTPIKFNTRVSRVVILPKPPYDLEGRLAGWGLIDEIREITTSKLIYTPQHVLERKECEQFVDILPPGTICGLSKSLRGYPSRGDSGSPLIVKKYIQIGIVSFKKPKISRSLVIYTDTGYFYSWITKTMKSICYGK